MAIMKQKKKSSTNDIFIDTDCISAFLWVKNESLLVKLYPQRIIIPKPVYNEIDKPNLAWMKNRIDLLIKQNKLQVVDFDLCSDEFELYNKMTLYPEKGHKIIGKGEASALALAKVNNGIIASNNLKDIIDYIKEYGLTHITTGDILVEAYNNNLITLDQGNSIWENMLKKRRKLGANTFEEYLHKR